MTWAFNNYVWYLEEDIRILFIIKTLRDYTGP